MHIKNRYGIIILVFSATVIFILLLKLIMIKFNAPYPKKLINPPYDEKQ